MFKVERFSSLYERLGRLWQARRLAQVLLVIGQEQEEKECLATWIAGLVLCKSLPRGEGFKKACGHCHSCQRIVQNSHPNVHLISGAIKNEVQSERPSSHSTASAGFLKRVGIGEIREINDQHHMCAYEEGPQVWIIALAHLLTTQAANGFLKTLEEPNSSQLFLLLAPSTASVLPTLLSRCQRLHLPYGAKKSSLIAQGQQWVEKIEKAQTAERLDIASQLAEQGGQLFELLGDIQEYVRKRLVNGVMQEDEPAGLVLRVKQRQLLEAIEKTRIDLLNQIHPLLALQELLLGCWPVEA